MTRTLSLAVGLLVLLALPASAGTTNPWLKPPRSFINMAHQGGEREFPSNTMYAFKEAIAAGADTLEIDINRTKDKRFVVMHDWTLDRTTDGSGYTTDSTLAQVQKLDGAYNFIPGRNAVPGEPAESYPFRGVATGDKPPPEGYTAEDFRVPSLDEVLEAFPDTPINIEIKGQEDEEAEFLENAELLAKQLEGTTRTDLIVASFSQAAVDRFHELAPAIGIAPGLEGLVGFFLQGKPMPNADAVVALQIPTEYAGITALTPRRVLEAHRQGWAVHMWLSGNEENAEVYNDLLDHCVDGIMPAAPVALERVLRKRNVIRPGNGKGEDPCAALPGKVRADDGSIAVVMKRRGVVPEAYKGNVRLTNRKGKLLGAGEFEFKNGKAKKAVARLQLVKRGRKAFDAGKKFKARVVAKTDGRRGKVRRRKTVRP